MHQPRPRLPSRAPIVHQNSLCLCPHLAGAAFAGVWGQVGRAIESQRYSPRGFTFLGARLPSAARNPPHNVP